MITFETRSRDARTCSSRPRSSICSLIPPLVTPTATPSPRSPRNCSLTGLRAAPVVGRRGELLGDRSAGRTSSVPFRGLPASSRCTGWSEIAPLGVPLRPRERHGAPPVRPDPPPRGTSAPGRRQEGPAGGGGRASRTSPASSGGPRSEESATSPRGAPPSMSRSRRSCTPRLHRPGGGGRPRRGARSCPARRSRASSWSRTGGPRASWPRPTFWASPSDPAAPRTAAAAGGCLRRRSPGFEVRAIQACSTDIDHMVAGARSNGSRTTFGRSLLSLHLTPMPRTGRPTLTVEARLHTDRGDLLCLPHRLELMAGISGLMDELTSQVQRTPRTRRTRGRRSGGSSEWTRTGDRGPRPGDARSGRRRPTTRVEGGTDDPGGTAQRAPDADDDAPSRA